MPENTINKTKPGPSNTADETRTLKVQLTLSQHALATLAANLRGITVSDYLNFVVAEAALRDTTDFGKVRAEVDNSLKSRRKQ